MFDNREGKLYCHMITNVPLIGCSLSAYLTVSIYIVCDSVVFMANKVYLWCSGIISPGRGSPSKRLEAGADTATQSPRPAEEGQAKKVSSHLHLVEVY